jgi:hypothetical protein
MASKDINVKVKAELTGVNKLRSELKDVKNELADALSMEDADPGKIEELTQKAGELKDQLSEVNEQVDVFATGSKYEAVSKSIGSIGKSILTLDFGKASARADAFAVAAKKITFKDAIGSVKDLGKTFMTIGKALITNPLFLLGTIITIIVKAVYEWLDSMGFIQKALDILMMPLNLLIEGLKKLGDWLGLTSFAEEEAAAAAEAAAERKMEAHKRANTEMIAGMENEIRLMRAQGASIEEIEDKEIELAKTKLKNFQSENENRIAQLEMLKKLGFATKEHLDELSALRVEYGKLSTDIDVMEANVSKNREDRANKLIDDENKKNDKLRQEAIKRKKETEKFIEDISRKQELANLNEIKDEIEKNEKIALQRLEWGKKDIDFTKMSVEAKLVYEEWYADEIIRIQNESLVKRKELTDKEEEDKIKAQSEAAEQLTNLMISLDQNRFRAEKDLINKETEDKLKLLREQQEKGLISKEQLDAAEIALEEEKQKRLKEIIGGEDGLSPVDKARKEAEEKLLIERQRLEAGIIDEEEYARRIEEINKNLNEKLADEDRKLRDEKIAYVNAGLDAAAGAFNSIASLSEAVNAVQIANAEGNEAKQEQLRKKGFEQNKKMQIAQATMSGIQGVINALTAQSTIPEPFGSILKGVNAAIVAGTTIANIAKIKSTKYGGGGSVSPDTGGGGAAAAQRSMPNVSFTGGNNQNTVSAGGATDTSMTVTAVVSETEITDVQNKNANRVKNAEL